LQKWCAGQSFVISKLHFFSSFQKCQKIELQRCSAHMLAAFGKIRVVKEYSLAVGRKQQLIINLKKIKQQIASKKYKEKVCNNGFLVNIVFIYDCWCFRFAMVVRVFFVFLCRSFVWFCRVFERASRFSISHRGEA